jgi:hypothetical protein
MMRDNNTSLGATAKAVGTTARTLKSYFQKNGIKIKRHKGGQYRIVLPPKELREQMMLLMQPRPLGKGMSATRAAKELHTTVRKMRYQRMPVDTVSGKRYYPILKKNAIGKWETNFTPLSENSLVVYGYIYGLNDAIQGKATQIGPKSKAAQSDPNYADIWWQIDFNSFPSTLTGKNLIGKYKKAIVDLVKKEMMTPKITNLRLATKFLGNATVAADAASSGRGSAGANMKLTVLEDMLERYDVHMDKDMNKIKMGIDDVRSGKTDWVLKRRLNPGLPTSKRTAEGDFQVMFLRRNGLSTYPSSGPKKLNLRYDLSKE